MPFPGSESRFLTLRLDEDQGRTAPAQPADGDQPAESKPAKGEGEGEGTAGGEGPAGSSLVPEYEEAAAPSKAPSEEATPPNKDISAMKVNTKSLRLL